MILLPMNLITEENAVFTSATQTPIQQGCVVASGEGRWFRAKKTRKCHFATLRLAQKSQNVYHGGTTERSNLVGNATGFRDCEMLSLLRLSTGASREQETGWPYQDRRCSGFLSSRRGLF
ncbi:hypothetical protein ABIE33_006929 [Ensifer sp. 4252]